MKRKILLGLVVTGLLSVGVTAIASNMGFKLVRQMTAGWTNFIALPYYNSYANAAQLFADIPSALTVSRWNNATGLFENYTGRGTNFTVTKGEAYIAFVSANSNWVIVGSHDDVYNLPVTAGYTNFISVPYHTTATNASTLFSQVPNCLTLSRWNNATGLFENWTGRGTNFALTPGEGLIAFVSANGNWGPAHY